MTKGKPDLKYAIRANVISHLKAIIAEYIEAQVGDLYETDGKIGIAEMVLEYIKNNLK